MFEDAKKATRIRKSKELRKSYVRFTDEELVDEYEWNEQKKIELKEKVRACNREMNTIKNEQGTRLRKAEKEREAGDDKEISVSGRA